MEQIDRARLVKLLNLTASPHDAEALSAARHSNEMLRAAGASWDALLGGAGSRSASESDPRDDMGNASLRDDIFGEGASVAPSGDDIAPPTSVEVAKRQARQRIRGFPLVARLALFPLWLAAECYVIACVGQPWPAWAGGALASLAVGSVSAGLYVALLSGLLG